MGSQSGFLKVLCVGDHGSGKSAFVQRLCRDFFTTDYRQTVGVDFYEYRLDLLWSTQQPQPALSNVFLQLWDISGDQLQHPQKMSDLLMEDCDALLLFYDITSAGTFKQARDWLYQIVSFSPRFQPDSIHKRPVVIVVGTKNDLVHLRAVKSDEHDKLASDSHVSAGFILSTKTRDGLLLPLIHVATVCLNLDGSNLQVESHNQNVSKAIVIPADTISDPTAERTSRNSLDAKSQKCTIQ